MKILKKLLFLAILFLIILAGCKKNQDEPDTGPSDVSFTGIAVNNTALKDGGDCFSKHADYALVTIDGVDYYPDVYYLNDIPYTKTLKLEAGVHSLDIFILYDDNNTPGMMDDDTIVAATPLDGSTFAEFIDNPLEFEFTVTSFEKAEVGVEVVCFDAAEYEDFGFTWFAAEQIVIREQCFFGDLCVNDPDDYIGSLYENQSNGLQIDMPAIFKIEVWRNDEQVGTFENVDWLGEGQPLCVQYGDYLLYNDQFEFKLFVYVRVGLDFDFVYFHSWLFEDAEIIENGGDGITEFVVGNCHPTADLVLPPYINLPPTTTLTIVWPHSPGSLGAYTDSELTNTPQGYDIFDGLWGSWCFDHTVSIQMNTPYDMDVYSSLYPGLMPEFAADNQWDRGNWIMNHLDWYPGYEWYDIQGALWLLDNPQWNGLPKAGVPALSTMQFAQQMYNDAMMYGDGFSPDPGGLAAVIFVPQGSPPGQQATDIQTTFIIVDP